MGLKIASVSYRYAGTSLGVSDVSFEVRPGELVALMGHSGSGKSTLLMMVAGLRTGYDGVISLDGNDLRDCPVHKRNIGVVFQNYALFPHLNVWQNVAYGLKLRKMPRTQRYARALALLEMTGLSAFADQAVGSLSGGQQQRVALARALAIDPRLLLLDEPLGALDASIRGRLRDEIRQLQQQFGIATLLVTHDQEEALTMADRVAVMEHGRILQLDTPRRLYEAPASAAVARFVGQSTLFRARVIRQNRVDLGFAELAASTEGFATGTDVEVLVRPEHVQADPPEGCPNRLSGQVLRQRYLGSISRSDFQIVGASQPLLCEGARVPQAAVAIAPEDLRLLPVDA